MTTSDSRAFLHLAAIVTRMIDIIFWRGEEKGKESFLALTKFEFDDSKYGIRASEGSGGILLTQLCITGTFRIKLNEKMRPVHYEFEAFVLLGQSNQSVSVLASAVMLLGVMDAKPILHLRAQNITDAGATSDIIRHCLRSTNCGFKSSKWREFEVQSSGPYNSALAEVDLMFSW